MPDKLDLTFATLEDIFEELYKRMDDFIFIGNSKADDPQGSLVWFSKGRASSRIGLSRIIGDMIMREYYAAGKVTLTPLDKKNPEDDNK